MNDKSNKSPKRKSLKAGKNKPTEAIREIEYYLNQNGNDTQIIKNIAISSLIPRVESSKQSRLASQYKLLGVPFFMGPDDGFPAPVVTSSPFWSFTMMIKEGGDHKLLFSSQEDAEELYTVLLKE
jgi:hypothetical protein